MMTTSGTLGLDIGGATLKAASSTGSARSRPFALWKYPEKLAAELQQFLQGMTYAQIALTMTGELCDCFETKADGVRQIVAAVQEVASRSVPLLVWQTNGGFATAERTLEQPSGAAAANWLALATFAARYAGQAPTLLIDIGSTTTDIIPIRDGKVVVQGRTDTERLATGELVYIGALRTPVCALCSELTIRGRTYRTMAELFATSHDAYLTLGQITEDPADTTTADGRPATKLHARSRLARMIGADATTFTGADAVEAATQIADTINTRLASATDEVITRSLKGKLDKVILSGQGEHLAARILPLHRVPTVSLHAELGPEISKAACAYAVAILAEEARSVVPTDLS
jgi:probable H4MPT-linked C1 transfer pathway protein